MSRPRGSGCLTSEHVCGCGGRGQRAFTAPQSSALCVQHTPSSGSPLACQSSCLPWSSWEKGQGHSHRVRAMSSEGQGRGYADRAGHQSEQGLQRLVWMVGSVWCGAGPLSRPGGGIIKWIIVVGVRGWVSCLLLAVPIMDVHICSFVTNGKSKWGQPKLSAFWSR